MSNEGQQHRKKKHRFTNSDEQNEQQMTPETSTVLMLFEEVTAHVFGYLYIQELNLLLRANKNSTSVLWIICAKNRIFKFMRLRIRTGNTSTRKWMEFHRIASTGTEHCTPIFVGAFKHTAAHWRSWTWISLDCQRTHYLEYWWRANHWSSCEWARGKGITKRTWCQHSLTTIARSCWLCFAEWRTNQTLNAFNTQCQTFSLCLCLDLLLLSYIWLCQEQWQN